MYLVPEPRYSELPGPNSIYLRQDLKFTVPVRIGETISAVATVTEQAR